MSELWPIWCIGKIGKSLIILSKLIVVQIYSLENNKYKIDKNKLGKQWPSPVLQFINSQKLKII